MRQQVDYSSTSNCKAMLTGLLTEIGGVPGGGVRVKIFSAFE